jgi:transcriptional regulator with XRE-family HTH domain
LRQVELAKRIGISKAYLSELEHSVKEPSVKVLKALAAALGVRMEDLIS